MTTGALYRVEDLAGLLLADGHGLFGDHVAAQLHGADDVAVVGVIDTGDDDRVGVGLGDHAVEVGGEVGGKRVERIAGLELAVVEVHAGLAGITQPDELIVLGVGVDDGEDVHGSARAGPDDGVTIYREVS